MAEVSYISLDRAHAGTLMKQGIISVSDCEGKAMYDGDGMEFTGRGVELNEIGDDERQREVCTEMQPIALLSGSQDPAHNYVPQCNIKNIHPTNSEMERADQSVLAVDCIQEDIGLDKAEKVRVITLISKLHSVCQLG